MDFSNLSNKNIVLSYSDPGGAKIILAIAKLLERKNKTLILSNRDFQFLADFETTAKIVKNSNQAIDLISEFNPEMSICGTSYTNDFELDITQYSKNNGISTYSFVDNWTGYNERFERNGKLMLPDVLLVISPEAKQIAINAGISDSIIEIMDNPYEAFLSNWAPRISKLDLFKEFSIDTNKKTIYIAPDPLSNVGGIERFGFDEYSALKQLMPHFNPSKQNVIIKAHPNQNMLRLKENLIGFDYAISNNDLLHTHLIFYSDLVISFFSNILIESKYLGTKSLRYLEGLKSEDLFKDNSIEIYNNSKTINDYV